jgi:predicted small secreted protein
MRKTFSLPTILLAISTLIAYSAMGCEDKDNFTPMM